MSLAACIGPNAEEAARCESRRRVARRSKRLLGKRLQAIHRKLQREGGSDDEAFQIQYACFLLTGESVLAHYSHVLRRHSHVRHLDPHADFIVLPCIHASSICKTSKR